MSGLFASLPERRSGNHRRVVPCGSSSSCVSRMTERLSTTDERMESAIVALRRLPYSEYLKTTHWRRVRQWALERARRACALCPTTRDLQVHHRSYARVGCEQPEDLLVLCRRCHERIMASSQRPRSGKWWDPKRRQTASK
jgi:hypothetical protein